MTLAAITPEPTDEEVAAILAAGQVVFRPTVEPESKAKTPRWRFSGRSWMGDRFA